MSNIMMTAHQVEFNPKYYYTASALVALYPDNASGNHWNGETQQIYEYKDIDWKSDAIISKPSESIILAKLKELNDIEAMRILRLYRNHKLLETDWMGSSDRIMTQAQKNYRTALRDIPTNITNGTIPAPTVSFGIFTFNHWP